jgi:hypothetical protein
MDSKNKGNWFGYLFWAIVIIGAVIYSQMKSNPTPQQVLQQVGKQADRNEQQEAEKRCADQEGDPKLYKACIEIERKRISDEYDERARESLGQ